MKKLKSFFSKDNGSHKTLFFILAFLLCFGTAMVISVSVGETTSSNNIVLNTIIKQFITVFIAYLCYITMIRFFSFNVFWKFRQLIIILGIALLLVPLLGRPVNGAYNWINFGAGFTLQPSEFFKPIIIVYSAAFYHRIAHKPQTLPHFLETPNAIGIIGFVIVFLLQKDFGSAVVILFLTFIAFYLSNIHIYRKGYRLGTRILTWLCLGTLFVLSPIGKYLLETFAPRNVYQFARFLVVYNPFQYKEGYGFQLLYGLEAIASGGLFGKGFGNSRLKFLLPEGKTDYISTLLVEEFGLLGFLLVTIAILSMVIILFNYSNKASQERQRLVLVVTSSYIMIHFLLNVGGVSGAIPLTGIPVLFISLGGSNLFSSMALLGVCQKIIGDIKSQRGNQ